MKLTDMKMTKKEAKTSMGISPAPESSVSQGPRYPYGLEVRLDNETLAKLGIDLSTYPIGSVCVIEARAQVTEKSERESLNGKERKSLELQITDLGLAPDKAAKKEKAKDDHLNSIGSPSAAE